MPTPSVQSNAHTPRVRNPEPQPAPVHAPEPASAKRDLASWWRTFSKRPAKKEDEKEAQPGIFGVPLIQSIPYANVAISLFNEHGESYIYGYVPIVVAKCGVYLKEKATDVEGIFRLAGSEKRIKELKTAFDTPPRYGKGLDWTGFTVHDAANILRRYFNNLPEPIIPLGNYDPFRQPLRGHQAEAVGHIEGQSPSTGGFDPDNAVRIYQHLIKGLPSLNRQLLLYILDLLAVFAAKSDVNKMTTHNLAAIFQPGILSHPQHDMSPQDYRLSQDVLIFLIDNQDHFLIGMEGTAVDEGTVKHVESGPPTPQARTPTTPGRNNSGIVRSASTTSSAGAESIRRYNGLRRNVSTSSKRSRHSGAVPSPVTPVFVAPTTSGVHRSNTLPSKRSPALNSLRFPRERSGPNTPNAEEVKNPIPSPAFVEAAAIVASIGPVSRQQGAPIEPTNMASPVVPEASKKTAPVDPQIAHQPSVTQPDVGNAPTPLAPQRVDVLPAPKPLEATPEQALSKGAINMPPERIEMPHSTPLTSIPQGRPAAVTPAVDQIPGAFPLPSPGIIPPSEQLTPNATAQAASELQPAAVPAAAQRGHHLTPTREKSEFLEGPIDSRPTAEHTPAARSFAQMLSKVAASPSSEGREGRKPNKLQKKRIASSTNPSAHSSTHSLTGGDIGVGMMQTSTQQHSPLHPPQPPFAHGFSQGGGQKDNSQPHSNDTVSSRNSGTTLKPSMSPSGSYRSHSTATEYSEAAEPSEETKEDRRSFWKGHKRGESRAMPTASQTDLHGSVLGGDKSMSSFGSSSGWGGGSGSRRSLQYESHQNPDLSTAYGSPPDHERPEKRASAFDWFHKMRHEHKDRSDRRERAKSPPGSSSYLAGPQNLRAPQDDPNGMGPSMEVPRPDAEGTTSTGSSSQQPAVSATSTPHPVVAPTCLRNELQAPAGAQSVPFAGPSMDTAPHAVQGAPIDVIPRFTSGQTRSADVPDEGQPPAVRPETPVQSNQAHAMAAPSVSPDTSPLANKSTAVSQL